MPIPWTNNSMNRSPLCCSRSRRLIFPILCSVAAALGTAIGLHVGMDTLQRHASIREIAHDAIQGIVLKILIYSLKNSVQIVHPDLHVIQVVEYHRQIRLVHCSPRCALLLARPAHTRPAERQDCQASAESGPTPLAKSPQRQSSRQWLGCSGSTRLDFEDDIGCFFIPSSCQRI